MAPDILIALGGNLPFGGHQPQDIIALALAGRMPKQAKVVAMGAAAIGLVGLGAIYEAGEHGGQLVYNYAGGIGTRSGDPKDVGRLMVAGLYQQALLDRQANKGAEGAALIDLAAARFPENLELQLMSIEWTTDVKRDPAGALQRLDALIVPQAENRLRTRAGLARATALKAQGNIDGARQVLMTLKGEFPTNVQIQRRLDELDKK